MRTQDRSLHASSPNFLARGVPKQPSSCPSLGEGSTMNTLGTLAERSAPAVNAELMRGFVLTLRAARRSERTVEVYSLAVGQLSTFAAARGMPDLPNLSAEHIREYLAHQHRKNRPATVSNKYRSLQAFYRWLEDEGEIAASPMRRIRAPRVPDTIQPHYARSDVEALLRTCDDPHLYPRSKYTLQVEVMKWDW
jgi:site-specific recombinase XerD